MEGKNVIKIINTFNELINKANTNNEKLNHDEEFFICNIELSLAESILKDFNKDTVNKLAAILFAETN